jgi:DnaJ-class molecular chaperone
MKKKSEIITFKADASLIEALKGVENRSDFIRSAILSALDSVCPLCSGSGILTPNQRKHWDQFSQRHTLMQCDDCSEMHLVCDTTNEGATT